MQGSLKSDESTDLLAGAEKKLRWKPARSCTRRNCNIVGDGRDRPLHRGSKISLTYWRAPKTFFSTIQSFCGDKSTRLLSMF